MPRETVRCPNCSSLLGRPSAAVAVVQCPRCSHTFELPPDSFGPAVGVTDRLRTRPASGDDEDAVPRPVRRIDVDLSGEYRVEPWRWLRLAMDHWSALILPYAGLLFASAFLTLCSYFFELLFRVPLACGAFVVALRILRREPWEFQTFFIGFKSIGALLATTLLHLLLWVGAWVYLVPALILMDNGTLPAVLGHPLAVGLVVLLGATAGVGLLFLYVRLSFANSLIVEQGQGVRESLRNSWRMTRGHFWGLLGYYALLYLIGFAGLMGCGVGLFLAMPLIALGQASAYLHATGGFSGPGAGRGASPPVL